MNKYTRVCETCGKTFRTTDFRRKNCSSECSAVNKRRIALERAGVRYPLKYKDLKIREVVNILVTEHITFSEFIENRDYYVFRYLANGELYYG